jgi:hypothetical protein
MSGVSCMCVIVRVLPGHVVPRENLGEDQVSRVIRCSPSSWLAAGHVLVVSHGVRA